jgi:hypothetical protein
VEGPPELQQQEGPSKFEEIHVQPNKFDFQNMTPPQVEALTTFMQAEFQIMLEPLTPGAWAVSGAGLKGTMTYNAKTTVLTVDIASEPKLESDASVQKKFAAGVAAVQAGG